MKAVASRRRAARRSAQSALLFSVPTTAERLGVSRASIYRMIVAGEIKSVRLRGRRLIPGSEIERLARGRQA